ncbi:MAG: hypothetical protein IMY67_07530 [Bacteroidetes bacterium]|nr:hypothetical protein [Bacteroidota bacterium]
MDQLEILKKQWQSSEQEHPKVSYNDIYKMLLKKSSSIVKWIFIISIAELLFWIGIQFLIPKENIELMRDMGVSDIMFYSNFIHYIIFAIFIYYFYRNYTAIQVTDNTKTLMKNILKTRKTVKYFVLYNVGMAILTSIVVDVYFFYNSNQLYETMDFASKGVPQENFANVFMLSQILVGAAIIGMLMIFYWLIYGTLLKRLKSNYTELKKMKG